MIEPELPRPLLWNPLPRAAEWLSRRTGKPFDVPALLDLLYQDARGPLVARQTVVKAPIPRGVHLAVVAMYGHPERDSLIEGFNHQHMAAEFGALPRGLAYVRHESLDVVPLHANQLSDLTLHGRCELAYLGHPAIGSHVEHEGVWIMPFAQAAHAVTPEVCGINGHDLYCLGELLSPNPPQIEPPPAPAAPVIDSIKSYSDLVQYRAASPRAPWNDDIRAVLFEEEARRQKVLGATGVRQKLADELGISIQRVGELIRDHKDFRRRNPFLRVAEGLRQGCDSSEKT